MNHLWNRIEKTKGMYTQFMVLALAARGKQGWVLLHCAIALCGRYLPKKSPAPFPEEEFLVVQETYPISILQALVSDIETKHEIRIGEYEIRILETGSANPWFLLDDDSRAAEWLGYRGICSIVRYSGEPLHHFLSLLPFHVDSVLRRYHRHPYSSLREFGEAVTGISLDESYSVTIDILIPSWTDVRSLSIEKSSLDISFQGPEQIADKFTVYADLVLPNRQLVPLQLSSTNPAASVDQGLTDMRLYRCSYQITNWNALPSSGEFVLNVAVAHNSGFLLANVRTIISRAPPLDPNPNKVTREHFERAVELSAKCIPETDGKLHPKVGAVIVKNGQVVAEAYRGEIGRGDHAEFIALERKARGNANVEDADLITTLEPCTTRSHDKRPCTSWIKSRRIRKVWIGTLDYNPGVAGLGEIELQKDRIKIGRFPDDLAERIIRDNRDFFDEIEKKQPVISQEEQKHERDLIIETLRDSVHASWEYHDRLVDYSLKFPLPKDKLDSLLRTVEEQKTQTGHLKAALNRAHIVQTNDAGSWIRLADYLLEMEQFSLATLSYQIATRIDATIGRGWAGLALSELQDNIHDPSWPYVASTQPADKSPHQMCSHNWVTLARQEGDTISGLKEIYRALQLGNRSEELWNLLTEFFLKESGETEAEPVARVWEKLAALCDEIGEGHHADICFTKSQLVLYGSGPQAVRQTTEPTRVIRILSESRVELAKGQHFDNAHLDAAIKTRVGTTESQITHSGDSGT